ncbi:MAG TPA: polysaccharide biosynthesis/export family protein [Mucilaginibacter sp.]|nr:polysaccharide biosynthesis/export family protein [Mucilaginibacter sp.]
MLFQQQSAAVDTGKINATSGLGTSEYLIRSQDILQIRNLQNARYIVDEVPSAANGSSSSSGGGGTEGQTYQVDNDGNVALPLIGRVQVSGLTRVQAEKLIEDTYRKNVLVNPIIDLKIVNMKVTILGEIRGPGNYSLVKDKTNLIELIGQAGGLSDKADEKTIKIIRGDPKNPQVTQVNLNKLSTLGDPRIILQNNDIIYIEQSRRAIKTTELQNTSTTIQAGLLILNTAVLIYALIHK